jgi:hypothetical protein
MKRLQDVSLYLPKYLSPASQKELFFELTQFPENIDARMYSFPPDKAIIRQGDGINNLLVVNLPDTTIRPAKAIVISNTCDIDISNDRKFYSPNICYCPILSLKKYEARLQSKGLDLNAISSHVVSIKKQEVTQIFYLPPTEILPDGGIVFFDQTSNCGNTDVPRQDLKSTRLFSLSNYGHYLFIFKLSIHFTRIMDGEDRKSLSA